MTMLFLLFTLVLIGVVVAVATGRITGGLDAPASSVPGVGLPDGAVTPADLDAVRFSPALRGYRMDEVDEVIDRLRQELTRRDEQLARLLGGGAAGSATGSATGTPPDHPAGRPDPLIERPGDAAHGPGGFDAEAWSPSWSGRGEAAREEL